MADWYIRLPLPRHSSSLVDEFKISSSTFGVSLFFCFCSLWLLVFSCGSVVEAAAETSLDSDQLFFWLFRMML